GSRAPPLLPVPLLRFLHRLQPFKGTSFLPLHAPSCLRTAGAAFPVLTSVRRRRQRTLVGLRFMTPPTLCIRYRVAPSHPTWQSFGHLSSGGSFGLRPLSSW